MPRWPIRTPEERFWGQVDKNGPVPVHRPELGPCHVWTGPTHRNGYGTFSLGSRTAGRQLAHRYAFAIEAPLGDEEELDHLCRNRPCVRQSHLEIVTHQVNMLRGDTIAARNASRTHCPQGHAYAGADLYIDPRGHRQCKPCRRAACRKSYANRKKIAA
jgi:hypothetical protein